MTNNQPLDELEYPEENRTLDKWSILTIVSGVIHIISFFIGGFIQSCGIDILGLVILGLGTVGIYGLDQFFRINISQKQRSWITGMLILVNGYLSLLYFAVMC